MRSRLLLFLLLLCLPCWGLGGPWSYYYPLTYDHTKVGASDSASFPALVYFSATAMKDSGHGGDVQSSAGADVEFFSDSALTTQIPSGLDYYDNVNGIGWFWVQITTLSHLANGTIYMAVGNGSPPARTTNPWDVHYVSVYHVGNGTSLSLTDSIGTNNLSNSSVAAGAGQVDGAASFSGAQYAYKNTFSGMTAAPITVSAWVKTSANAIFLTLGNYAAQNRWQFDYTGIYIRWITADSGGSTVSNGQQLSAGVGWQYIVGIDASSTSHVCYVNASPGSVDPTSSAPSGVNALTLGAAEYNSGAYSSFLIGSIDEVHISNIARSSDWITAEYNNQLSPGNIGAANFWTFGAKTGASRRRVIVVN